MTRWLALLLICATGAGAAEIDPVRTLERLRACYDPAPTAAGRLACMHTVSETCQAEEEGGYSTMGMAMCNQAETEAWDVLLNEEYKETRAWSAALDEDEQASFPNLDSRADTLRDAQRAWIAYRDAECRNEYANWGAGSMRHIVGTACYLDMTAKRTVELWAKRSAFE